MFKQGHLRIECFQINLSILEGDAKEETSL